MPGAETAGPLSSKLLHQPACLAAGKELSGYQVPGATAVQAREYHEHPWAPPSTPEHPLSTP